MKTVVSIGLVAVMGALGYYGVSREHETHESYTTHKSYQPDPPTSTLTDSTEVFKRAFWKRPGATDKILHAERREWADADGLRKWQWFLAVEPSQELVKYLRDDNAFSLVAASSSAVPAASPDWFSFKPGEVEVLQAPHGGMCLFFSKSGNLLFATDSGSGFAKGAQAPPSVPVEHTPAAPGRIPTTPPPDPRK